MKYTVESTSGGTLTVEAATFESKAYSGMTVFTDNNGCAVLAVQTHTLHTITTAAVTKESN